MKIDVLLGLQWGDEGKGKIVDVLTPQYDIIARFQGGPNAGHTLKFEGTTHVLHTIPSGIFHDNMTNVIGNGVVIDPVVFEREVNDLIALDVPVSERLLISKKAHLILPTHRLLDAASEAAKGADKIGSTLRGIGPTYMDKTGRNGLRVGDISRPDFQQRYDKLVAKHKGLLAHFEFDYDLAPMEAEFFASLGTLKSIPTIDSEQYLNDELASGKKILAEGAQGSLLDIDFGSYPFVTSSNTVAAGACTGLGMAPARIGRVIGIFKAYCTRVGSGPFPTELEDEVGERIRKAGGEFGATTGRPRRCGWIDLPALRYAIMINGVTDLCMTKADVLDSFESIMVATKYQLGDEVTNHLPFDVDDQSLAPIYEELQGWNSPLTELNSTEEFPQALNRYIDFLEAQLNVPISVVSVGPDRTQTIFRDKVPA
jgi:adenylosuccinate synthase